MPHKKTFSLVILLIIAGLVINHFSQPAFSLAPCHDCNVILISLDACRPDHMSVYRYYRNTTPFLESLDNMIVFERAIAPTFYTPTSHATMLTGLEPFEHGVIDFHMELNQSFETIGEYLQERGYSTVGIVNVGHLSDEYGFGQGFDSFHYIEEMNASKVTDKLLETLPDGDKFFVFAHYFQLHSPYKTISNDPKFVDPEYPGLLFDKEILELGHSVFGPQEKKFINDNYDDDMLVIDGQIQKIMDFLGEKEILDRTIIIITSDHGEALGEYVFGRNITGHTFLGYPTIHIPLLLIHPNMAKSNVNEVVGLTEIQAMVKHLLGFGQYFNIGKGVFSYIPVLEHIYPLLKHRAGYFEIVSGTDTTHLSIFNLNNESISSLIDTMAEPLKKYFSPWVVKEISCGENDFSIAHARFSEGIFDEKSQKFLDSLDCAFFDGLEMGNISDFDNGIYFFPSPCHFFYSYTDSEKQYLIDCNGDIYYFDEEAWKRREFSLLTPSILEKSIFYLKNKHLIERTPPRSLIQN